MFLFGYFVIFLEAGGGEGGATHAARSGSFVAHDNFNSRATFFFFGRLMEYSIRKSVFLYRRSACALVGGDESKQNNVNKYVSC